MRRHGIRAEAVAQVTRDPFRQTSSVHEHERRPMPRVRGRRCARNTPPTPRATSPPRGSTWAARAAKSMARRCPSSTMAQSPCAPTRNSATAWIGRWVADSPIRMSGRSATCWSRSKRQREVCAAPRADDRMDFIHDDRAHRAQHVPAAIRRQQQVKRLRGRDENVRWRPQDAGAFPTMSCRLCERLRLSADRRCRIVRPAVGSPAGYR